MKENAGSIKIQQSVADFYETHGADFAQTRGRGWGVMRLVQEAAKPGMTVIDVGAGNARLADVLPANVRYVGIEPSSTLRAASEHRLTTRGNAEMRPGGFPSLPAKDAEADVIACLAVFHHLATSDERSHPDLASGRATHELARITKPGGIAIVTVWNLRGTRMFSLKTWAAAWLRLPFVRGGGFGDVWIPWNANGAAARRFVHAFTLKEFTSVFDPKEWNIERAEPWGSDAPTSIFCARNLVVVARRR